MCVPLQDLLLGSVLAFCSVGPEDEIQVSLLMTSGLVRCTVTEPFLWTSLPTFELNTTLGSWTVLNILLCWVGLRVETAEACVWEEGGRWASGWGSMTLASR